eukprot:6959899-Prymnesium_polylepis.1
MVLVRCSGPRCQSHEYLLVAVARTHLLGEVGSFCLTKLKLRSDGSACCWSSSKESSMEASAGTLEGVKSDRFGLGVTGPVPLPLSAVGARCSTLFFSIGNWTVGGKISFFAAWIRS